MTDKETIADLLWEEFEFITYEMAADMADHLLANGVTLTDTNVGKWIPVTERLPEDRQRILCFRKGKYGFCALTAAYSKCLASYCDIDFHGVKHGGFFDYDSEVGYYELHDITHWMPLPEPPKGDSI